MPLKARRVCEHANGIVENAHLSVHNLYDNLLARFVGDAVVNGARAFKALGDANVGQGCSGGFDTIKIAEHPGDKFHIGKRFIFLGGVIDRVLSVTREEKESCRKSLFVEPFHHKTLIFNT